jgi:hypothetical protein
MQRIREVFTYIYKCTNVPEYIKEVAKLGSVHDTTSQSKRQIRPEKILSEIRHGIYGFLK